MKIFQNISLILLSFFILSACGATVKSARIIPAGATNVTQYKTVAFLDFTGNRGGDVSARLETLISEASINEENIYSVANRKNIEQILQEQQFQATIANPDTIIQFGQLVGVEAIWSGEVNYAYDVNRTSEKRSRCVQKGPDNRCVRWHEYIVPCEDRNVTVTVIPKLTSIATGQIVYTKTFQGQDRSRSCHDGGGVSGVANLITTGSSSGKTEEDLYQTALGQVLRDFRLDVAPYVEYIHLILMEQKDGTNDTSKAMLKNGISWAKANRMEKACEQWSEGLKQSPRAISLLYNVGICSEMDGKYQEALNYYKKAEDYAGKPISTITNAINRINKIIADDKKLQKQM